MITLSNQLQLRTYLNKGFIAPTKFMSNSNIIGKYAKELTTNKQDFDDAMVRQLIKTEDMLGNIRKLIVDESLDTNTTQLFM